MTINFLTFPLAAIRSLKPVEVSAVFDADVSAGIEGTLYRLNMPAAQYILRKNTLCGGEETQWMATYATGHTLKVAFFSGDDMPAFTFDAIQTRRRCAGRIRSGDRSAQCAVLRDWISIRAVRSHSPVPACIARR